MLQVSSSGALFAGSADSLALQHALTNIVPVEETSGGVLVQAQSADLEGKAAPLSWSFYSWEGGNFLEESGPVQNPDRDARPAKVISAWGTWNATNWEFSVAQNTNGRLVLYSRMGKGQKELFEMLGGRSPSRYQFDVLLRRGVDPRVFDSLRLEGNQIRGYQQGKFPIRGTFERRGETFVLEYEAPDLGTRFTHTFELDDFPGGGALPGRLVSVRVEEGVTNTTVYSRLRVQAKPFAPSLSPFELYPSPAEVMHVIDDKLYQAAGNTMIEIPEQRRTTVLSHRTRQGIVIFLLVVFGTLTLWFYVGHRHRKGEGLNE